MKARTAALAFTVSLALASSALAQNWQILEGARPGEPTGAVSPAQPFAAQEQPAPAQEPPVVAQAPAQAPASAPAADQPMPVIDETALRYFASQGDTRRLEIEIARLRALYPQWTPPADPLAVPESVDSLLEAIWMLYSQGRFAEAREAIATRQMNDPNWEPPVDLLDRLTLAEARERLVNASNLDQYETVIRIGSSNPGLLTCSEVDVLWRVAESFAMTERQGRARDAYRYVLTNCDNTAERLATMQNAAQLLSAEMRDELLALERFDNAGAGEFAPVRDNIARDALAAAGDDDSLVIDAETLARVERLARQGDGASDARLLGWYYLGNDDAQTAEELFRMALEREAEGDAAEGLALALIALDRFADAEDIVYPYRDENVERRGVYLAAAANLLAIEPRVVLSGDVLTRIVGEVAEARNAPAAQQLGWYARAYGQHETAGQWFASALQFDPEDEASAYGLALTRFQLADTAGLAELKRLWAGRSERIVLVGTPQAEAAPAPPSLAPAGSPSPASAPSPAPAQAAPLANTEPMTTPLAYTAEQPVQQAPPQAASVMAAAPRPQAIQQQAPARAAGGCTQTLNPESLSPASALARGWCLMDINRPLEAAKAFEVALRGQGDTARDAAYGQSLAYLRAGLVDEAAVAAASAPMTAERAGELQANILSERASGAFEQRRYVEALMALDQRAQIAPERNDLMVLRGYAYLNLRRYGDAERVFQAVAGTGNRDGLRGLAAVREQTGRQR
ncbi:hypothetical protein GCM10007908_23670 [Rhizobium albus]|nr:hypothetical protein GCM10007908_23670 [Rhizobium albus]